MIDYPFLPFLPDLSPGLECLQSGTKLDKEECLRAEDLPVPDQTERCTVDCQGGRGGCVIGQWSAWSQCASGCPSTRKRKREVSHECSLPKPPPGDGSSGPLITQVEKDTPVIVPTDSVESQQVESCPCDEYRYELF